MEARDTKLSGCIILEPRVFEDSRGYFFESYNEYQFEKLTGRKGGFIQDNQSSSGYGVIRGLHFQKGEFAQAKLIRALKGRILDVAVDIRPDSPTYKQWVGIELSDENKLQLYIPRGFAHGFSVLSENAVIAYKCDNVYNKEAESGFRFDDPALNIDWSIPEEKIILSEKDRELPYLF